MGTRIPAKWIVASAAVLIALAAIVWANRSPSLAPGAAEEALPLVSVATASLRSVTATVTFTGTLAAKRDMPIGTEGEGGRIVAVLAEAGDQVAKGQLLARLDSTVLSPQTHRLEASLEEARAQAALSEAEYQRARSMDASGAFSVEEIERRRALKVTDEARVKVAAAMLAESRARLTKTELRTPEAGVVLTRTAEVGQTASPGETLFRVAASSEIEMRGLVAERDVAALSVDQPAKVYLTGIAQPFEGKVRLLGAVVDPQNRQVEIRIALAANPVLRPGAFARGEVVVSKAERPVLPQTAVLSDQQGTYVFVVTADSAVERRGVGIADVTRDGIVIASGLEGSERIVTTAGGFLHEGERVKVAPAR